MQEEMSHIIAMKNRATAAINGEVSSDGLSAMLGDEGDLRSLLLKSVKDGKTLKGSAEDWISQTSERAREILENIGRTDVSVSPPEKSIVEMQQNNITNVMDLNNDEENPTKGVTAKMKSNQSSSKDTVEPSNLFDVIEKGIIVLTNTKTLKRKEKANKAVTDGQLTFELF